MRALSLFGVLALAKLLILLGTRASLTGWAPVAYFWQDVLVALVLGAVDFLAKRPRAGWYVYAALVIYIALGVPVAVVLGTPMTLTMFRGARGPVADSIAHDFTAANVARIALVLSAGAILPIALSRLRRWRSHPSEARWGRAAVGLSALFIAAGPLAASRVETIGLDRNAITALVPAMLPGASGPPGAIDWRLSPVAGGPQSSRGEPEALRRFRGAGKSLNVLIVVLESTAAQYLPAFNALVGASRDPMPNLSALSRSAVVFENTYAAYPESIKGFFSTLCSQYPAFGVSPEVHAEVPCASVADEVRRAGYRTALFHSGRFRYLGMDAIIANKGFELLEDAGAIGGNVYSSFGVDEPATVDRLLKWIDQAPQSPFMAVYLPVAGHHPYATQGPGPFPDDSDHARYLNALHEGDEALGSLVAGLRTRGLEQRTALIVFGDHGEAFGQHQGNVGHTLFINEENVRVPYLIAIPGVTTDQVRVAATASLIDVAPTVLDLLDLPRPSSYQGASLLRPGARMALFFTDYSLGLLGLRDGCWKYIFETNAARSKLFDVCVDPQERADLSDAHDTRVNAYRDRVIQWSTAQKARVLSAVK